MPLVKVLQTFAFVTRSELTRESPAARLRRTMYGIRGNLPVMFSSAGVEPATLQILRV